MHHARRRQSPPTRRYRAGLVLSCSPSAWEPGAKQDGLIHGQELVAGPRCSSVRGAQLDQQLGTGRTWQTCQSGQPGNGGGHIPLLPCTPGVALGHPSPACARPGVSQEEGQGCGGPGEHGHGAAWRGDAASQITGVLQLRSPLAGINKTMAFLHRRGTPKSCPRDPMGPLSRLRAAQGPQWLGRSTQSSSLPRPLFMSGLTMQQSASPQGPASPHPAAEHHFPLPRRCPPPR